MSAQLSFALWEVWLGLDMLAESYALLHPRESPEPNDVADAEGTLADLLYASLMLGTYLRAWPIFAHSLQLMMQQLLQAIASDSVKHSIGPTEVQPSGRPNAR